MEDWIASLMLFHCCDQPANDFGIDSPTAPIARKSEGDTPRLIINWSSLFFEYFEMIKRKHKRN